MAGRSEQVPYNPVPSVEAQGGGGTPMSVRSTPADMGAQVGEAATGAGNAGFEAAQHFQDIHNDSTARDATTQASLDLGKAEMEYRQNRGNNAVGALPAFQQQVLALQKQYGDGLSPAAQAKFKDDFARESNMSLRSAGSWAGDQAEAAHLQSYDSQIATKVNMAALHAGDPDRFNHDLSDIATAVTEKHAFQGHDVAVADADLSHNIGEAVYAGVRSLNNSDPDAAQKLYDQYTQGGITAMRDGKQVVIPYLDAEHRTRIETMMSTSATERQVQSYKDQWPGMTPEQIQDQISSLKSKESSENTDGQTPVSLDDGAAVRTAISKQEHPGSKPEPVSIDGAVGNHQILPDTFAMYAKPGEKIDNPKDNDAVYGRIMDDYQQRYKGDPSRIAVAYFSGTGNVAPVGNPTPWVADKQDGNGKSVSSYVKDVQTRLGTGSVPTQVATSQDSWLHDTLQADANKFLKQVNDDPKGTWEKMNGSQPINISDSKSVATGIQTALAISGQYHVPVASAVWSKEDAARLVSRWDTAPLNSDDSGVQSKQAMLMSVRQGAGVYAADVLEPLKKSYPNIVYAAGMDDPKVAMEIVKGDERIKESKAGELSLGNVDATMNQMGYDKTLLPQQYDQVKSAARSIFASRYSSDYGIAANDDKIKSVIKDSLGGMEQTDYAGGKILTPPNVPANQMQTFLRGLDNNDILTGMQNAQMQLTNSTGPFQTELPRDKGGATFQAGQTPFTLQTVGPGLYLAMQPNGEPYAASGMKGGKMFLKFNPDQISGKNQQMASQPQPDKDADLLADGLM